MAISAPHARKQIAEVVHSLVVFSITRHALALHDMLWRPRREENPTLPASQGRVPGGSSQWVDKPTVGRSTLLPRIAEEVIAEQRRLPIPLQQRVPPQPLFLRRQAPPAKATIEYVQGAVVAVLPLVSCKIAQGHAHRVALVILANLEKPVWKLQGQILRRPVSSRPAFPLGNATNERGYVRPLKALSEAVHVHIIDVHHFNAYIISDQSAQLRAPPETNRKIRSPLSCRGAGPHLRRPWAALGARQSPQLVGWRSLPEPSRDGGAGGGASLCA
eukprot:scaffold1790_cov257-Pinguiococcus_pyrenoidosus.AAC.43